jgi:ketosteroid isomerase-like protein
MDIVWKTPGNSQIAGERKGHEEIFALFALCHELSGGTMEIVPQTIEAKGDGTVVSTHRLTAERDGKKLDVVETETMTLADGKLTRVDEAVSDQAANDAFWA